MPTPVSTARQCLTEEAARALDDAVAVARRRSHAQTTSLHAVSALLAMPSSVLREVCVARARSSAYSSRLQFRALELCVGVSLDRLPSAKSPVAAEEEPPPVSNSLMAAIKRSQANQRRHPETYHLQQIHSNGGNQSPSVLKVELKYFILSILDDPIVSRVFGEAGFRSSDIKIDVVHPPVTQFSSSRFPRARCPPLFLCNLPDSDPGRLGFGFSFCGNNDFDENCRRIGEVLGGREKKNPLLVGVCANEALKTFVDSVNRGKLGFLPLEISGLSVISIEKEIREFCVGGSRNEDENRLKIDELGKIVEQQCPKSGLVLNLGEFKVLIGEAGGSLENFVSKMSDLLKLHEQKLWFIGSVASNETYSKLLDRFPTIVEDWDLHLLPITSSSKRSNQGVYPKSSLMGSFVPFGGFFSSTSDFRIPFSGTNQSIPRCHLCNEKYEQEVAAFVKAGSGVSVADQYSENLPSWLRVAEPDIDKGIDMKAKDDGNTLGLRITGLQKKWDDICQRIHQTPAFPKLNIPSARSQFPAHFSADQIEKSIRSPTEQSLRTSPRVHVSTPEKGLATVHTIQIPSPSASRNLNFQSGLSVQVSKPQCVEDLSGPPSNPVARMSPMTTRTTSSSLSCVTTDLGLGTIYASSSQEQNTPISLDQRDSGATAEKPLLTPRSSACSVPISGENISPKDFKFLREFLSQKVSWQTDAVNFISEIVSGCRAGYRKRHGGCSSSKTVWLTFLGPDRVGKKKIASALADIICSGQQNFICADFKAQDNLDDRFRGKTVVDYVAGELARRPHSVIFLENVDKAEFPDRISLYDAARTGKLRDSHGREISMNNVVFVVTSGIVKDGTKFLNALKFSEERILGAKSWKLQIKLGDISASGRTSLQGETSIQPLPNKRKQDSAQAGPRTLKTQRSYLDLNLPVEEIEENNNNTDETDTISENTEAWLEDFLEQVDGNVTFKPFDFDGLAKKIERDILSHFHRSFGSESTLEIDEDVIVQILAASWSSDDERTLDQWLQNILAMGFAEARQKYGSTRRSVVNLVACKGCPMEEQAAGTNFPAKIELL